MNSFTCKTLSHKIVIKTQNIKKYILSNLIKVSDPNQDHNFFNFEYPSCIKQSDINLKHLREGKKFTFQT